MVLCENTVQLEYNVQAFSKLVSQLANKLVMPQYHRSMRKLYPNVSKIRYYFFVNFRPFVRHKNQNTAT